MPSLQHISATFFVNVLNRLGVKPPFSEPFSLINTVQPVSIVDADISIPVIVSPPVFGTPFSAGHLVAPAINTVLADTGQLAAGNWVFKIAIATSDPSIRIGLQHRDAANAANIWELNSYTTVNVSAYNRDIDLAKSFALNERLRVITLTASGAGSFYDAVIFALQLS